MCGKKTIVKYELKYILVYLPGEIHNFFQKKTTLQIPLAGSGIDYDYTEQINLGVLLTFFVSTV